VHPFSYARPSTLAEALALLERYGDRATLLAGGTDLLVELRNRSRRPEVVIDLKRVAEIQPAITKTGQSLTLTAGTTMADAQENEHVQAYFPALVDAAATVGSIQIRNRATLAGNICQRPWCWYYRNGFKCLKNGGTTCYSIAGENEFHAIFGGGPSYIVHPSDTAPALVALDDVLMKELDRELAARRLNQFGDPPDTMYAGGTPLFDERTGKATDRIEYVLSHQQAIAAACGAASVGFSAAAPSISLRAVLTGSKPRMSLKRCCQMRVVTSIGSSFWPSRISR